MSGDKANLREVVEAIAAEERAKRHEVLADRLTKALDGTGALNLFAQSHAAPAPQSTTGRDFVVEREPNASLATLVLDNDVQTLLAEILEENYRSDLLRSYGLQPRHRILLSGPPGNGKTTIAEGMAEALGRTFLTVRYDALVGSYLGETNQRLRQLFDYVKTVSCVLLFDEFDALAKERGDEHETGEIKRVVSGLLLEIDRLPSYVLVVAATNHHELLDRAVWRRFQARVEVPAPTREQFHEYFMRSIEMPAAQWAPALREIDHIGLTSFSEAADFVGDVRRRIVLSGQAIPVSDVIRGRANQWSRRMKVSEHGGGSRQATAEAGPTHAHRAR